MAPLQRISAAASPSTAAAAAAAITSSGSASCAARCRPMRCHRMGMSSHHLHGRMGVPCAVPCRRNAAGPCGQPMRMRMHALHAPTPAAAAAAAAADPPTATTTTTTRTSDHAHKCGQTFPPHPALAGVQALGQTLVKTLFYTLAAAAVLGPSIVPAAEACAQCGKDGYTVQALGSKRGSTAADRFTCTPLSDTERLDAFDLDGYTHKITTRSKEAQRLFDQGMSLAFQFNRDEAMNAFQLALKYDPTSPMLYWGVAYALGPDLNKAAVEPASDPNDYPSFSKEDMKKGLEALQTGARLAAEQLAAPGITPEAAQQLRHELAYISALLPVFSSGDTWGPSYREAQSNYALALEAISREYPNDEDALPLAAEALFDLQPWDAWDPLTKAPVGRVLEVIDMIDRTLQRSPRHALGLHLKVHITESLPTGRAKGSAAEGEAAADLLAATKGSFGHLTHMPSHTYHRVGRWKDAVESNVHALEIDTRGAKRCLVPYLPVHNMEVLLMGAGNGGLMGEAEENARGFKSFPERFGPTYMADGRERAMLPLVWTRFGQWQNLNDLKAEDFDYGNDGVMLPKGAEPFNKATYHYTRAMAMAAEAAAVVPLGAAAAEDSVQRVEQEVAKLSEAVSTIPQDPRTKPGPGLGMWTSGFNMSGRHLLAVAEGRVQLLRGNPEGARRHLQQAKGIESEELYAEPSYFYQPARQCEGAILLQQGRFDEAARVYREDLANLPGNVWSEVGLSQSVQHLPPGQTPDPKIDNGDGGSANGNVGLPAALATADKRAPLRSSCPAYFN